jgi:transcriptional regulator of met regulon
MTMRRQVNDRLAEFPVRVYFREVCGTKRKDGGFIANARWGKAPIQMLTKCTEAAGLREAFPDELGGQMAAEEADASSERVIDVTPQPATGDAAQDLNTELGIESNQPPPDPEFVDGYDKAAAQ